MLKPFWKIKRLRKEKLLPVHPVDETLVNALYCTACNIEYLANGQATSLPWIIKNVFATN